MCLIWQQGHHKFDYLCWVENLLLSRELVVLDHVQIEHVVDKVLKKIKRDFDEGEIVQTLGIAHKLNYHFDETKSSCKRSFEFVRNDWLDILLILKFVLLLYQLLIQSDILHMVWHVVEKNSQSLLVFELDVFSTDSFELLLSFAIVAFDLIQAQIS